MVALLPFKHPFTAICCGSTQTGKTLFVLSLIDNIEAMVEPLPKSVVYYFMEYQPVFDEYPQIDFRHGVPKTTELEEMCDALTIFDDMMMEANGSLLNVFTRGSHHIQNSVIHIVQNFQVAQRQQSVSSSRKTGFPTQHSLCCRSL